MKVTGKVWKFGDDISTDLLAPGRYAHLRSNLPELAKHTLEDKNKDFAKKVKMNDIVVAGQNFGLGSSREHAAAVLKILGVGAVIADSTARIFFRNCINVGLPVIIMDSSKLKQGDKLEIDFEKGYVTNLTGHKHSYKFAPLPKAMMNILNDGGLIAHIMKHKKFKIN